MNQIQIEASSKMETLKSKLRMLPIDARFNEEREKMQQEVQRLFKIVQGDRQVVYSIQRGKRLEDAKFVCRTGRKRPCGTLELHECVFSEDMKPEGQPEWENRFYSWISDARATEFELRALDA